MMNTTKPWIKKLIMLSTVKDKDLGGGVDESNVVFVDTLHVQVATLLGPIIAESGHIGNFASLLEETAVRTANTPLHVAAWMGHLSLVRAILDRRPRLDQTTERDGLSPIYRAEESGHAGVARELLSRDPDLFYSGDARRRAPLHYAAALGKDKVVRALVEFASSDLGDDGMDLRTDRGETALHLAVKKKHKTTFAVLMRRLDQTSDNRKNRILYDTPDREGKTVIELARCNNMYKVIELPELYVGGVDQGCWVRNFC